MWNLGCCRRDLAQTLPDEIQEGCSMTIWPSPWPVQAPALPSLECIFENQTTGTRQCDTGLCARCPLPQQNSDSLAPVLLSRQWRQRNAISSVSCAHAPAYSDRTSPSFVVVVAQPLHAAQPSSGMETQLGGWSYARTVLTNLSKGAGGEGEGGTEGERDARD